VSFFAVFDGHGGSGCAEYLRDNLHHYIARQDCFPTHPEQALKLGFKEAEEDFMEQNQTIIKERSGSCACAIMVVDDVVYTANVGDSRAVVSW
jgi:protein phosphatase 2C family protein 2/3